MLQNLTVQNIALVSRLSVSFYDGMHALTGETGAGKSIIVDSLMLLLGGRMNKDLIRTGCDKALVQGLFDVTGLKAVASFCDENGIDCEDGQLVLTREITLQGRSVCRAGGIMLPLQSYKTLTAMLMDIHGQHEHQSLMDDKNHLHILDAFGEKEHQTLLSDVAQAYETYHDALRRVAQLKKDVADNQERLDLLRFQQGELKNANLQPGEEDELTKERDLNRNAEKIRSKLSGAYAEVYDGASGASAAELLRSASALLRDISAYDDDFSQLGERLTNLYYEAEDIGLTLRDKLDGLNFDENRLEEIEARLELIRRLSRKYGATSQDMLDKLHKIEALLDNIENADDELSRLEKEAEKQKKAYMEKAERLSASRRALADKFCKKMEIQLGDLNMKGTSFVVSFNRIDPSAFGIDECVFLISPNRGEKLQSLSETASGGELSRLMLAIKSITAEQSSIPSMVFDEIDTGISGRTAQVVAEKMADIARFRQVLCVTHLTQIASMADHQYLVEKGFDGERTVTHIEELDQAGRVQELARMLGGVEADSESARAHGSELLRQAEKYKAARN